jgi:uncharacterized protein YecT (DUF1311 family)
MKRLSLAAALTILSLQTASADECLDKAKTQADINACADKSYKAADAELNKLYKEITQRLDSDADAKKRFVAAQRNWVAFRDAECSFATSRSEGGSVYPMVYAGCLGGLTTKRVADFKQYLSCKEGDLDCPVPAGR